MKLLQNIGVGFVVSIIALALALCELLYFCLSLCRAKRARADKPGKEPRRIVLFDGLCVMCNGFARFTMARAVNPTSISFIPFQDVVAKNHMKSAELLAEFPELTKENCSDRLALISGKRLLWGSDSVLEVLTWCYAPYPLIGRIGLAVPSFIRDPCYMLVSKNRYSWFGVMDKMWKGKEE
eukprot:gb/GEZN01019544.1/.p1 GENE.gb/GEZN01019544.1/~~gb/GEZN01019544.1/.p1  ORF type:complete len:181 (+),score=25.47 gb/GEZN01019544.1/:19-561(+)